MVCGCFNCLVGVWDQVSTYFSCIILINHNPQGDRARDNNYHVDLLCQPTL